MQTYIQERNYKCPIIGLINGTVVEISTLWLDIKKQNIKPQVKVAPKSRYLHDLPFINPIMIVSVRLKCMRLIHLFSKDD